MQTRTSANNIKLTVTKLPAPVPGKIIIPISLWPEYLCLHHLEVIGNKDDVVLVYPSWSEDMPGSKGGG